MGESIAVYKEANMDDVRFWQLIEDAKARSSGDVEEQVSLLGTALTQLPAEEIEAFHDRVCDLKARARHWDLWAAGYIVNSGCSDDGFEYFRGWLITRGRDVYENALRDADTLADVLTGQEEYVECEEMLYVALQAYEDKTGKEMPVRERIYAEIGGTRWTEENVDSRCPRLSALFGS